ncbi:MAG: class I SAM-dependent methyltransferase [Candidatus Omnitrophota bacterium]
MNKFDELSSTYKSILDHDVRFSGENAEYFALYKAEYIKKYLGSNFRGRILDYGCGVGLVIKFLRSLFDKKYVEIIGFDNSLASIKQCRNYIEGARFTSNDTDLEQEFFDTVIMANVLHHIDIAERGKILKKAITFLKKGGYIFIFEHNPYNPITRMVVKSSPIDEKASLVSARDIMRLLRSLYIDIHKKRYIVFFPRLLKKLRFLEPIMGYIPIGAQYVYVGQV